MGHRVVAGYQLPQSKSWQDKLQEKAKARLERYGPKTKVLVRVPDALYKRMMELSDAEGFETAPGFILDCIRKVVDNGKEIGATSNERRA